MAGRPVAPLLVAAWATLWSSACALSLLPSPEEQGRKVYLEMCSSCHGTDAGGGGPVAAEMRHAPPDLTRIAERHSVFSRGYVMEIVTGKREMRAHGSREMPVWSMRFQPENSGAGAIGAIFFTRRLDLLLDYLETIQLPVKADSGGSRAR